MNFEKNSQSIFKKEVLINKKDLKMYEISGQDNITEHAFNRYMKDKEQDEAIKNKDEAIKNKMENSVSSMERKIRSAPRGERAALIREGLQDPDTEVQKICAEMIGYAPEEEQQAALQEIVLNKVREGLQDPEAKVREVSAKMILYAPEEEQAALIREGLQDPDIEVQKICAGVIRYAPRGERAALQEIVLNKVREGLQDPDIEVQKISVRMIGYAPEREKEKLFKLIVEKGLGDELIKPPLYDKKEISEEKFSRQSFEKTGSETTLVGGKLKNKAIIRHISPEAFLAWQKLYENYQWWREAGFDYVPIEPIISYKLNKKGLVDVFSGVLDLSFAQWSEKLPIFEAELKKQKQKILNVLSEEDVKHGHTHNNNFCLRFFRDKNNKIDFNKTPRLYLIDFDGASS